MKNSLVFILSSFALFLNGCVENPKVVYRTEYKKVYEPIKCIDEMPKKPTYILHDPQSAEEWLNYLKLCEELLEGCAK